MTVDIRHALMFKLLCRHLHTLHTTQFTSHPITVVRDCCVYKAVLLVQLTEYFFPWLLGLCGQAFSIVIVDAISLWNNRRGCKQPGGKHKSQITPASSAERPAGMRHFLLLDSAFSEYGAEIGGRQERNLVLN